MKIFIACIVGFAVALIVMHMVELIGHNVYPLPEGFDFRDHKQVENYLDQAPVGNYLFELLAHVLGSLMAGIAFHRVLNTKAIEPLVFKPLIVIGFILMGMEIFNLVFNHHPLWFTIADPFVFIPLTFLGGLASHKFRKY